MTLLFKMHSYIRLLYFPFYYVWEIIAGALRISWDVLHPRPKLAPVLVRVPVEKLSARQRLVLAALVTMTPGTLSVDLLDEADQLVVHGLYDAKDPEALLATIRNRYQPVVAKLPI